MNKHMKKCMKGEDPALPETTSVTYLPVEEAETVEIPSDMPVSHEELCLEQVNDALMQLESGEVIIEEPDGSHKQLIVQLTSNTVSPLQYSQSGKHGEQKVIIRPLDEKAIMELPTSWNERTFPKNVSVESIVDTAEDNKDIIQEQSVTTNHVQEYHITQPDGSEQIIQLIYHDQQE
jgi:hypothetical protein